MTRIISPASTSICRLRFPFKLAKCRKKCVFFFQLLFFLNFACTNNTQLQFFLVFSSNLRSVQMKISHFIVHGLSLMCVRRFASNDIFFSFKFDWIKDAYKNTWIFYAHTMTIVRITTTVHIYWLTIHHFAWHVDTMMNIFHSIREEKRGSAQYLFIGLFCTKINTKKEFHPHSNGYCNLNCITSIWSI